MVTRDGIFMEFGSPRFAFALAFLASGMASTPALAVTATASFSVTATVVSGCQVTAPTAVFATNTTAKPATSSISVTCTNPTAYNVSLSAGRANGAITTSATKTTHKTDGSAAELQGHELLPDLVHAVNRDPMAGRDTVAETDGDYFQPAAVYGETAGRQFHTSAPSSDVMVVTVTY